MSAPEPAEPIAEPSPSVFLIAHPLVRVKVTQLRDRTTSPPQFRRLLREAAALLFTSATDEFPMEPVTVETPLAPCEGTRLARPIILAPIMRAGLGLLEGVYDLVPEAAVAHIGIYRDETTLEPHCYYSHLPSGLEAADVVLMDPMLATGQSAAAAASQLKARGAKYLIFLCVVCCPEGIEFFHAVHPDVPIYTAAIDHGLNERGYIVPGLGDAGDRYFGT